MVIFDRFKREDKRRRNNLKAAACQKEVGVRDLFGSVYSGECCRLQIVISRQSLRSSTAMPTTTFNQMSIQVNNKGEFEVTADRRCQRRVGTQRKPVQRQNR